MASSGKLYHDDAYIRQFAAIVTDSQGGASRLSATAFYPGGGGQPSDCGTLEASGQVLTVVGVRQDATGEIWHDVGEDLRVGLEISGEIDWAKRLAFMRRHTLLHIVNALVFRDLQGLITGVHIGQERCSIDFDLPLLLLQQRSVLEDKINEVISSDAEVISYWINEDEFLACPSFIRTADVAPPIVDGKVRIVSIGDFDAQACGGTHVHRTSEIGPCRILKVDNKGRKNRRIHIRLTAPSE